MFQNLIFCKGKGEFGEKRQTKLQFYQGYYFLTSYKIKNCEATLH